jgi:hypothetical protein
MRQVSTDLVQTAREPQRSAQQLTPEKRRFVDDATQRVVGKGSDAGRSLPSALGKVVEDRAKRVALDDAEAPAAQRPTPG